MSGWSHLILTDRGSRTATNCSLTYFAYFSLSPSDALQFIGFFSLLGTLALSRKHSSWSIPRIFLAVFFGLAQRRYTLLRGRAGVTLVCGEETRVLQHVTGVRVVGWFLLSMCVQEKPGG